MGGTGSGRRKGFGNGIRVVHPVRVKRGLLRAAGVRVKENILRKSWGL
jgi:hypothetical protein